MGSFNNWEDDEDSFYDWGSQFGKAKVETESNKPVEVTVQPDQQVETPPEEPVKEEKPEEVTVPEEATATMVAENDEEEKEAKPRPPKKPFTREELEKLSADEQGFEGAINQLCDRIRQLIPLCGECQLPKGVHTTIKGLVEVSDTVVATRSLADFYLESVDEQRFVVFKETGLASDAQHAVEFFNRQEAENEKVLDELEDLIKQGEERVVLNLRMRVIKENVLILRRRVKLQAEAYSKAIDLYSPDKGSLVLLERFAEKGDREVMNSIDNTLNLADTGMVLVEDAPAMLVALDRDDTDTIIRLQQKLIDHFFDNK